ncbi:cytochrome P450 [Gloeopeniophorella convolvens]|nr:cytochrome P450 [Gloeopeniophorella convolvens]
MSRANDKGLAQAPGIRSLVPYSSWHCSQNKLRCRASRKVNTFHRAPVCVLLVYKSNVKTKENNSPTASIWGSWDMGPVTVMEVDLTRVEVLFTIAALSASLALFVIRARGRRLSYPPGPRRLPIIGNLLDMPSREEWVVYKRWSDDFGSDVVHVDVLGSHIIILNSMEATKQLLERRSSIYSDRPPLVALLEFLGMTYNIGLLPYGRHWRYLRSKFHINFHPAAAKEYEPLEQRATHRLLRSLLAKPGDFPQHLRHMAGQTILSIAYGIDVRPENDPYVTSAEQTLKALALASTNTAFLFDNIPWLKHLPNWFPGFGLKREALKAQSAAVDSIERPYKEVKAALANGTAVPSVAAAMISTLDSDPTAEDVFASKAVPGIMYMAGADTTVSALLTFMLAMLKYPDVQRKAQAEIDRAVGTSRLPDFADHDALPYVGAVLKETLRWHPVLPLAVPHCTTQSDTYDGHFIPAGATIIGNTWAIFRDPKIFPEPDKFTPERWLSPDAPRFPDQAFGFGRRECPGRYMARSSVWATISGILAAFDLVPVKGSPLDEEYSSGLVAYVKPFKCHIRPRSEAAASLVRATENELVE